MKIEGGIWYRSVVDKLLWKHHVAQDEVEEVFRNTPRFTFLEKAKSEGSISIRLKDKLMLVDI